MIEGKSSPYLARRVKKFKRVKKDYQQKNLNNPFFRKKQLKKNNGSKRAGRNFLRPLLLAFILFALFYLFFMSSLFGLKQVKVLGLSRIPEDNVAELAWRQAEEKRLLVFKQKNILFFDTDDLQKTLTDNFSFDSVRVYKQWPHTLAVSLGERGLSFIWQDGDVRSFSDSHGCLIKDVEVKDEDISNYPFLSSVGAQDYLDQKSCLSLDDDYLKAVFRLYDKLKAYPDMPLDKFLLDGAFNTLQVKFKDGPNIFFNVKEDLDKQLNKLVVIKQDKGDDYFKSLEYIDLRYGDRAYFK